MEGELLGRAMGKEGSHVCPCICPSAFPPSNTLRRSAATGLGGGRRQATQARRKRCHGVGVNQVQEQTPRCGQGAAGKASEVVSEQLLWQGTGTCLMRRACVLTSSYGSGKDEKPRGPCFSLAKMNLSHFLCSWKLFLFRSLGCTVETSPS